MRVRDGRTSASLQYPPECYKGCYKRREVDMETTESATRLERLEAARDRLEVAQGQVDPDKLPTVVREYRAVMAEIEEIEKAQPKQKGTPLDELQARRSQRGAATAG